MPELIYVGDTRNLARRILSNHLTGNVEGSAFRRHVARAMDLTVLKKRRPGGTIRRRLREPDGEARVSRYLASGFWRVYPCPIYEVANELQWFAIDRLHPHLNKRSGPWPSGIANTLGKMCSELTTSPLLRREQLEVLPSGPGVYVFYHRTLPSQ